MRLQNPQLFESENVGYTRTGFATSSATMNTIKVSNGTSEIILLMNPNQVKTASKQVTGNVSYMNSGNYQVLSATKGAENTQVSFSGNTVSANIKGNNYILLGTKDLASVDGVVADEIGSSNVTVTGGNGEIIINGDYNNVQVYTIAGQSLGTLTVPAGLYIVNVYGNTSKVLVKEGN